MNIKISSTNKKPLKIIFGSALACTATLTGGLFTFATTNLNAATTPAYVTYLQNNWNWNAKLRAKTDETTYANKWLSIASIYPKDLPFMTNDYAIAQSGIAKNNKFDNQFISALTNFGILAGAAYQPGQATPFSTGRSYYLYYPLLGISQVGLNDDDFYFESPQENEELITIVDSQHIHPKFHYSIKLTAAATNAPADQTIIAIKKYDNGQPNTKTYTRAVIKSSPTKEKPVTTYTPTPSTTGDATNAFVMNGSDFTVTLNKGKDNDLSASPITNVYHTHTNSYALRNMFAFDLSETNSNGITTQQLLGVDTTALMNGTEQIMNPNGLDYLAQYGVGTKTSLSTGAIIGIVAGSTILLGLTVGLGIWLYKRYNYQTAQQPSPTNK